MKMIQISGIDEVIGRIRKSISAKDRKVFLVSFIVTVIFYFPMLTAWLGNPDSFWNGLVYKNGSAWENRLGRFGITPVYKLKEYIISPTLSTLFCFCMLALICVLLVRLFEINRRWMIVCMILIIDLTPGVMSTLTYYYCSDVYFLAYFLNVAAVYLLTVSKRKSSFPMAVLMMAYAVSCYQAYISVAAAICLLMLWKLLMEGKEASRNIVRLLCKYIAAGVSAGLVYLGTFKLLQLVFSIEPAGKFVYPRLGDLFGLTVNTFRYFVSYFFTNGFLYNEWGGRKYWNAAVVLFTVLLLVVYVIRNRRNVFRYVGAAVCLICLPVAFLLVTVIAPSGDIFGPTGILTIPAMNFAYLVPVILMSMTGWKAERNADRILEWTGGILCFRVILLLISFTAAFQGYMQLNLSRMCTVSGEMAAQIMAAQAEAGEPQDELPVVFVGKLPEIDYHNALIDVVYGTTAEHKMIWDSYSGSQQSWMYFLRHITGKGYETVSEEECQEIIATDAFRQMPVFPVDGSVKVIGDTVVVKLSNDNEQ